MAGYRVKKEKVSELPLISEITENSYLMVADSGVSYKAKASEFAGSGGGTSNYNVLSNKPKINNVELSGNKSILDLGLASSIQGSKADTALQSFTETDPTVPSWAKTPNKPSYTPEEIGAPSGSGTSTGTNTGDQSLSHLQTSTDLALATVDKTVIGAINETNSIARGKSRAMVFLDLDELNLWVSDSNNTINLNQGDNLYIIDVNTPDYWWDGTQIQQLETQKVDLTTVVSGPATATDGAIALYDGTSGKLLKDGVLPSELPISDAVRVILDGLDGNGVVTGMTLSINALDNTKFDIAPGTYHIGLDGEAIYPGEIGITVTNIATANVTYVALDYTNNDVQQTTNFSNTLRRSYVIIGAVVHSNRTIINVVNNTPDVAVSLLSQYNDLLQAMNRFSLDGNIISPNGANLSLNKSYGTLFGKGINYGININDPHVKEMAALTAFTTRFRRSNGIETADTTTLSKFWESSPGTLSAMASSKYYIYTVAMFPSNIIRIQYGAYEYQSIDKAVAGISTRPGFTLEQNIKDNGLIIAYIVVQGNVTNLQSDVTADNARIFSTGKLGSANQVIGGTTVVGTLQTAYNNSTEPEIITSSILDGITFRRGSTADTDTVFGIQNGAGINTMTVDGNGNISAIPALGPELFTSFTVAGNWTLGTGYQATNDGGTRIRKETTGSLSVATFIPNAPTIGDVYVISVTLTVTASGGVNVLYGGVIYYLNPPLNIPTTYTYYVKATTTANFYSQSSATPVLYYIDSLSIKKITNGTGKLSVNDIDFSGIIKAPNATKGFKMKYDGGAVFDDIVSAVAVSASGNMSCSNMTASTNVFAGASITLNAGTSASPVLGIHSKSVTSATLNNQKWSPAVTWTGSGWNTTSSSAKQNSIDAILKPIQGATSSSELVFQNRLKDDVANTSELLKISSSGVTTIGGSTDNVSISSSGITLNGSATVFDDLKSSSLSLEQSGPGISQNIPEACVEYAISANLSDYMVQSLQLPHSWKIGSSIYPHLHFRQTISSMPNFLIRYRWQINGQAEVTSWTNYKCNSSSFTYVSGSINQIAYGPGIIPPTGAALSDIIEFRIIRDSQNSSGLFTSVDPIDEVVRVKSFDVHYEMDSIGSNTEYTK